MNFRKSIDTWNGCFLCLIAASLLFKVNYGNLFVIAASIFNIFSFKRENLCKIKTLGFIFPVSFFLISLVSSVFSKNYIEALEHLDLEFLAVLLPFVIINNNISYRIHTRVLNWFYWASVISTLILLMVFISRLISGVSLDDLIFHNFTKLYDQHPVYFAMFLSLALFFSFVEQVSKTFFLAFTGRLLLICGIILCASKVVFVMNLCLYFIFILFRRHSLIKTIYFVTLLFFVSVIVYKVPFVNSRINKGLSFNPDIYSFKPTNDFSKKKLFTYEEKTKISDLELRYIFASIGLYHLTQDEKLLTGYGHGDFQDYLDYYYMSYNLAPNWYEDFNVHNQYLHVLITHGLFSLLLFLAYLLYSFYLALKRGDLLFIFFLIMVSAVFMFEVILVRNKGIIFFYFFNSFFLYKQLNFENRNFRN